MSRSQLQEGLPNAQLAKLRQLAYNIPMPYRSTEKTRHKKDSKRTAMMQAAVQVFAEKGYQSATIRDIVKEADVAIGTFYFYFPDKETLFLHLYEETADFLIATLHQSATNRTSFPQQVRSILQAYVSIAIYEPAVIQLLLAAGAGAIPSLVSKQVVFQEKMAGIWQVSLAAAMNKNLIAPQNARWTAEALAGAVNQVILNFLAVPDKENLAREFVQEMTHFVLRAAGFYAEQEIP